MTLMEAHFALDAMLLERHAAGLPTRVEQIDCVACEDGTSVMAYCYLEDEPLPLAILFDKPAVFDRHACSDALMHELSETVH